MAEIPLQLNLKDILYMFDDKSCTVVKFKVISISYTLDLIDDQIVTSGSFSVECIEEGRPNNIYSFKFSELGVVIFTTKDEALQMFNNTTYNMNTHLIRAFRSCAC